MTDIRLLELEVLSNPEKFELIEDGIYRDLNDSDGECHRIALSYKLENNEGQYPLEDILDKYFLFVTDFINSREKTNPGDTVHILLGGMLDDIQKVKKLLGKHVYNEEYTKEDGKVYSKLIVE